MRIIASLFFVVFLFGCGEKKSEKNYVMPADFDFSCIPFDFDSCSSFDSIYFRWVQFSDTVVKIVFSKEEKQDLMHIAICKALSLSGYYHLEGLDKDGWPHWKLIKKLPHFDLLEQEKLLKMHALEYFEKEYNWKFDAENPG